MIRSDDSIWDLKLVIEKADRLQRRQFTKYLRDGGNIGFCGKQQDNGFVVAYEGPDEEAIDAFLFTFRFFVQNNEPTSFANIEKLISSLPLEPARIDAVVRSRTVVNDYLDQERHIVISGKLTRRHIFEVFLWGGLAHANRQKKETFDGLALEHCPFSKLSL